MKHLLITVFLAGCMFIACQKTIDWSLNAVASLAKDSSENCMPITVHGVYNPGKVLNDSNFVVVTVNVDSPGNYIIFTNIVNGYSFKASGTFPGKGALNIKLKGYGTPVDIGVNDFIVHLNNSSCTFSISVSPDSSGSGGSTDTLYTGAKGTLSSEQFNNGTAAETDFMWYDSSGFQLREVTSNNGPLKKIFYNSSNLIDKIDYYTGTSSYSFDHSEKFVYDGNNSVIAILRYSQDGSFEDSLFAFKYNTSNDLDTTIQYSGGSIAEVISYNYDASGNIAKVYKLSGTAITDSLAFQYDSRQNKFGQIYPQFMFLDPFALGNVNRAFYYSANYPSAMILGSDKSLHPITIDVNADGKPTIITLDGIPWYTYNYN
jgi:hypothetical protein